MSFFLKNKLKKGLNKKIRALYLNFPLTRTLIYLITILTGVFLVDQLQGVA